MREPKNERQQALRRAGENEMQRLQILAPEMVADKDRWLVRTGSGVLIGSAYIKPAPAQTADGEKLQTALLSSRQRQHGMPWPRGNGKIRSVLLAVALFGGLAVLIYQPWR